mmetsp:Transcript_62972/g.203039  ORF Transcript_62972/g.203039 Transcript_62972/m.203039 type:complete len:210 (+) Transcript_62972:955-1584(+)
MSISRFIVKTKGRRLTRLTRKAMTRPTEAWLSMSLNTKTRNNRPHIRNAEAQLIRSRIHSKECFSAAKAAESKSRRVMSSSSDLRSARKARSVVTPCNVSAKLVLTGPFVLLKIRRACREILSRRSVQPSTATQRRTTRTMAGSKSRMASIESATVAISVRTLESIMGTMKSKSDQSAVKVVRILPMGVVSKNCTGEKATATSCLRNMR